MSDPAPDQPAPDWLELVRKQVASLRYGTIELTVQDAKVVEIQTTEKLRFDKPAAKAGK